MRFPSACRLKIQAPGRHPAPSEHRHCNDRSSVRLTVGVPSEAEHKARLLVEVEQVEHVGLGVARAGGDLRVAGRTEADKHALGRVRGLPRTPPTGLLLTPSCRRHVLRIRVAVASSVQPPIPRVFQPLAPATSSPWSLSCVVAEASLRPNTQADAEARHGLNLAARMGCVPGIASFGFEHAQLRSLSAKNAQHAAAYADQRSGCAAIGGVGLSVCVLCISTHGEPQRRCATAQRCVQTCLVRLCMPLGR